MIPESTLFIGKEVDVVIDRSKDSAHPVHGFVCPVNYGYIPGIMGRDNEELDAYVLGVNTPLKEFRGECIAVIRRLDDADDKLIVVPRGFHCTPEELKQLVYFQEKWFSSIIIMKPERKRKKWTMGWGFTALCDLDCPFCYSFDIREKVKNDEITLKQAESFLQNNKSSLQSINFGTGECFLSPQFPGLLTMCKDSIPDLLIAVTTNGALVHLKEQDLSIIQKNVNEIDISIDFDNSSDHDAWRGKQGTWERAIMAVKLAKELNLPVTLVMVGTPQTLVSKNIQGMISLAGKYNLALRINFFMPASSSVSKKYFPAFESILLLFRLLKKNNFFINTSDSLFQSLLFHKAAQSIKSDRQSCRILPDGRISPSTYLFSSLWTIASRIRDIHLDTLEHTGPFITYNRPPVPSTCFQCELVTSCQGGSVERRWLCNGNLHVPDPLCPMENNSTIGMFPLLNTYNPESGPTIHLDYLPTLLALPPDYPGDLMRNRGDKRHAGNHNER